MQRWQGKVNGILEEMGFNPQQKVMTTTEPLICTEALIRTQPTNFGQLACESMQQAFPSADVCIINSGAMRLDDNLSGTIIEYDILRTFPYGGPTVSMDIPGKDLNNILNIGLIENQGEGGYFQIKGVSGEKDKWLIKGTPLDANKTYQVVLLEFVAQGKEARLGMLSNFTYEKPAQLTISQQSVPNDIRSIVIAYMQSK